MHGRRYQKDCEYAIDLHAFVHRAGSHGLAFLGHSAANIRSDDDPADAQSGRYGAEKRRYEPALENLRHQVLGE
jgi:hypothetical protein